MAATDVIERQYNEENGKGEGEAEEQQPAFSSSAAIVFSCLGTVVGTGNIWRFPRIAAQNSATQGTLIFLATWAIFLFLWSSPMLLIEYAAGRYFKKSPIQLFRKAMGDKFIWCGAWVTMVTFLITCYYSVVLGWCFYYVYKSIADGIGPGLPDTEQESLEAFTQFAEKSVWQPVVTHAMSVLISGAAVIGGITWIEKANMVLVPTLLLIIVFTYCWSVVQPYADYGVRFLFAPDWGSFSARLWVDSATQNAFDTGAAMGLIVPYATYMTRKNGVVRFSTLIPAMNNFVSMLCALTIFATVFSTLVAEQSTLSRSGIVEIIKQSGPASTGLTFIWIPVLFSKVGPFGNVLCVLFFLCLSFAGVSSLIASLELVALTLQDFGIPRKFGTPIVIVATFLLGLPSALNISVLTNQDFVWGFALMISGLMFQFMFVKFGIRRFQNEVVNDYGLNDWKLTIVTVILIVVVAPLEALGLLGWWGYDLINSTQTGEPGTRWFEFGLETFLTVVTEWLTLLIVLLLLNIILYHLRPEWMDDEESDSSNKANEFELKSSGAYVRSNDYTGPAVDNAAYASYE